MSKSETEYLRHIRDEARYLTETSRDVTWDTFAKDETLKRYTEKILGDHGDAWSYTAAEKRLPITVL